MALKTNKLAAATAVAAAFSMLATPVAARDYYGHHHHYDDDDIDTGDVIAGVVLLGAIAAIATTAHNQNRERETYRYPPPEPQPDAGYQVPGVSGPYGSRGIDRAVDLCVGQLERGDSRVASVDSANRIEDGWRVDGVLENGAGYTCTVGSDGRISDVRVGDPNYAPQADGQYDDDYYTSARAEREAADDGRYDVSNTPDFEE